MATINQETINRVKAKNRTKINVMYIPTVQYPSVACYTDQSPLEGPYEANIHNLFFYKPYGDRPF